MPTRYPLLFWDLDGTLTDPKEGITKAVRHALVRLGISPPAEDALTPFIGPPLAQSFQAFFGLDPAGVRQAIGYYREYFEAQGIFENKVYPEIPPLLESLAALGQRMAVATSKPQPMAERILDHFDLSRYFYAVYAADMDEGRRSTKREVLALAVDGLSPAQKASAAMIGDHPVDVEAAHHHGLTAIAVLYGYGDPDGLRSAGPQHLAASVPDLAPLLIRDA